MSCELFKLIKYGWYKFYHRYLQSVTLPRPNGHKYAGPQFYTKVDKGNQSATMIRPILSLILCISVVCAFNCYLPGIKVSTGEMIVEINNKGQGGKLNLKNNNRGPKRVCLPSQCSLAKISIKIIFSACPPPPGLFNVLFYFIWGLGVLLFFFFHNRVFFRAYLRGNSVYLGRDKETPVHFQLILTDLH